MARASTPRSCCGGGRARGDGPVPGGCSGDSGGGLVVGGDSPASPASSARPVAATGRYPTVFVRVAEPGIDAFVSDPDPVPRPAVRERPGISGRAVPAASCAGRPGRGRAARAWSSRSSAAAVLGGAADAAHAVVLSTRVATA